MVVVFGKLHSNTHCCVQFQSPKHIHKNDDDDCADGDEGGGGNMRCVKENENALKKIENQAHTDC